MKYFALITSGDIHMAADTKRIDAQQFSKLLDAEACIEIAKQDAERLQQKTQEECQQLKKEAKEAGFAEGLVQFNEHLIAFDVEIKRIKLEAQKAILPLAIKAAKKILARQLDLHPDTVVDIVMQALAPVTQHRRITIYVNKGDKEPLEAQKPKIREIFERLDTLSIQEREDVNPGGCIIETERGILNASIETQWRSLEAAFERYLKR